MHEVSSLSSWRATILPLPPDSDNLALLMALLVISFLFLAYYSSYHFSPKEKNLPPNGPPFAEYMKGLKAENQSSLISQYGNIFTIPSPIGIPQIIPNTVVINEPELVKELCIRQANMYRPPCNFTTRGDIFAKATRQVVGTGVTGLKGPEWQWRKRALLKEFHKNRLMADERGLLGIIVEEGRILCEQLSRAANENEDEKRLVEMDHLTTTAAVGVVLFFLFGRRLEFDTEVIKDAARVLIDTLFVKLNPLNEILKYIPGTGAHKAEVKLKNAQRKFDLIVGTELDILISEYRGNRPVHPDRVPGSVIASLIENEEGFRLGGTEAMLAEARVFVQAGFETTAHSLAFAMGMMAERPDLARDMAKQGMEAFGNDSALSSASQSQTQLQQSSRFYEVTMVKEALERTPLVQNFFQEALRLYPLAPALGGECINDIDIITEDGSKYTLPRGTGTTFFNMSLQRQVSNPDEIRPERWEVGPSEKPFLHTFQNGPHACPGKPLSLLEGHVFLLLAVMQFEFEFPEDVDKVEYEDNILLRPKNGMPLYVKRRL